MLRTVTIVNYMLGILIIAIAAWMVSDRLGAKLGMLVPDKVTPVTAQVADGQHNEGLMFYAPVLSSGLFGKANHGQLTPVTGSSATAQVAPVTAPAELMLLGTVVGSFRDTFALVRHNTKHEERVFRLGEMVFDAGRLADVGRERAFIVVNNRKVELLTPMTPAAAPPPNVQQPGQPGVMVANNGSGSYVVDQRALNAALDNPAQAMSDARLLPSQKDGKVEGFRASEVRQGGMFAMLGIRNGDVLLRLNDFPMDSPDKALQSFIALKGQSRLKLDLIRDGQPQTFNYDIR